MLLNITTYRSTIGFTYLEVLIALTIAGIALSGNLSLQTKSLAATKRALDLNQVVIIIDDLANRIMLTSPSAREHYLQDLHGENSLFSSVKKCFDVNNPCTSREFATFNIAQINERLTNLLTNYTLQIKQLAKLYAIYMVWADTSIQDCMANEGGDFCLVMKIFV